MKIEITSSNKQSDFSVYLESIMHTWLTSIQNDDCGVATDSIVAMRVRILQAW